MSKSRKIMLAAATAAVLIVSTTIGMGQRTNEADAPSNKMDNQPADIPVPAQAQAARKEAASLEKAGLYRADGTPHPLHTANPVTGKTLNVVDYGADPADNAQDDAAAINKAIKAAQRGDEVFLPSGVYNLRSTVPTDKSANIELKSGVNLRGESQDGVILRSYLDGSLSNSKVMRAMGLENIVISRLTVSSDFKGKYPTDHSVSNPDRGGPHVGIYIEDAASKGSSRITIDHVTVEKYQRMGIRVSRSHDVVVRNALFRNATDLGGGGAGYGVVIQGIPKENRFGFDNDSYFNVVESSRFEGPYIRHGVLIQYYSHHNAVRGNTFHNTALDAIDLHGEFEYSNEIHDNDITGVVTGAGIGLGNTGGTAPSNHSASGPRNYIHNNTITGSRNGITVTMGSPKTVIENNTITGSKVKNGTGITVMNGPETVIQGNTIRDNLSEGFWGILLQRDPGDKNANYIGAGIPDQVQIIGNTVTHNSNGVKVAQGTNITIKDNRIQDNVHENLVNAPASE